MLFPLYIFGGILDFQIAMTSIKELSKLFENNAQPLTVKPKPELYSPRSKKPMINFGTNPDIQIDNLNNNDCKIEDPVKDEPIVNVGDVIKPKRHHVNGDKQPDSVSDDHSKSDKFPCDAKANSQIECINETINPESQSPNQLVDIQHDNDVLVSEHKMSGNSEIDYIVRQDNEESSDSVSLDDFTFELNGSIYNLPGLENFISVEVEEEIDSIPIIIDETDNSTCVDDYQVDAVEEIRTSDKVVNEVKVNLSRIGSKRLIEEIFNTSVWRNSQNFTDDFIFSPTVDTNDSPNLNINTEKSTDRNSIISTTTIGDDRRVSTQSLSTKPVRRSLFGGIFRSKRSAKV